MVRKILIPIDGSDYSKKALEKGKEMAVAFGGDVVILNVIPSNIVPSGRIHVDIFDMIDEYRRASDELLRKSGKFFTDFKGKVETVSLQGDAPATIVDYAREHGIDLIVMGSYGTGAIINRIMAGSVATKVLHHTEIPVLIVK